MSEQRVIISVSTLLTIVGASLLLVLLWQLRGLVVVLMISMVIASTLSPIIAKAERLKTPRWLAVLLVYLGLIAGLFLAGLIIGPTVATQIERLLGKLPTYLEIVNGLVREWVMRSLARGTSPTSFSEPNLLEQLDRFFDLQALTTGLFKASEQVLVRSYGITRGVIGNILSLILALLLSGYMLVDSERLIQSFVRLFPQPWEQRLYTQVKPISQRMGGYIQGRILVSAILGVTITIGLILLGISEFALGLGVIAGFTNLIPFFGPVLGAVPALIVAIAQGGWLFLWVLLLFIVIQNLETYVLDPLLVGNTVQMLPLYQLLAVLGGVQVLGIIGALLAPPWVAGAAVVLENLYLQPKNSVQE